ncbi:MAG: macro domain-containing protein [Hyphomicrobiaceae bacterium]
MRTMTGDLIALAKAGTFDVIAHGCNCMHSMGGGLAAQIRHQIPEAYAADLATRRGERAKLGTCSVAVIETPAGRLTVVNAYTQFAPSTGHGVDVDYDAVRRCMRWIGDTYRGKRIGLPLIGAGLAGGDWPTIERIIAEELHGENVTIVKYGGAS